MKYSHKDYESKPSLATPAIAKMLNSGCLNLFLGAGVSKGFGLPQWPLLIARMLEKEGQWEEFQNKSDKDLARLVDPLDTEGAQNEYLHVVHAALYKSVDRLLSDQLSRSPLLLAVAALLTGTCRGRIAQVFTYNYDDLLEQYLKMLGLAICRRTNPFDYSTKSDVEINHVHGFLPQSMKSNHTTELILSDKSYRSRNADIDEGWSSCVERSLYSKAGLFIGLSGDDSSMLTVIARARKKIKRIADTDYHGYWLLTPEAYSRNAAAMLIEKICPIPIDKEQLPSYVFDICQKASRTKSYPQ